MQPKINDRKKHFALCLKKLLTYLSVRKHFYSNLFRNVKNFVPYSKACKLEILTSSVHLKNNLKTYMCFSEKYHTFLFNICDGLRTIWYHLCNFKIVKIIHGGVFLQSATLLKVIFLHGCFSRFLNWTGGTKSCKASHLIFFNKISEDTNKISSNFLNLREILREKPFLEVNSKKHIYSACTLWDDNNVKVKFKSKNSWSQTKNECWVTMTNNILYLRTTPASWSFSSV